MEKFLLETTEVYRINSKDSVAEFIENAKQDKRYILKRYTSLFKEKKIKGEIVDQWYKVTLVKGFNDEKEPEDSMISVEYTEEGE